MKRIVLIGLAVVLMIIPLIVLGCSSNSSDDSDNKELALQVARDWTTEEVDYEEEDYITGILAIAIYNNTFQYTEIPVDENVLHPIIKEQVSEHVIWTYSEPEKLSANAYEVKARTTLTYEIPQIGSGTVDVSFNLTCSTIDKEVRSVGTTYHSFEYTSSPEYLGS